MSRIPLRDIGTKPSDPEYIAAATELTEVLHAWAVRWVAGHKEADRYSCAAANMADDVMEGLLIARGGLPDPTKVGHP